MKTFEEAMDAVYRDITGPAADRDAEAVAAACEPFEGIMQEALRHPRTQEMILQMLALVRSDDMRPADALASAFANGLRIGLEMERRPLE